MREQKLRIKDIIQGGTQNIADIVSAGEPIQAEDDFVEETYGGSGVTTSIPVSYLDVDEIILPEIKDVHGRISDIVDAIEVSTGVAVVPFEMANIAPEITKLQRHEIFQLGDRRFAMSKEIREGVVTQYTNKIVRTLTSGVPFVENLATTVTYNGKVYNTLALSKIEWTTLLSKFRKYKHSLRAQDNSSIILEILAEHV